MLYDNYYSELYGILEIQLHTERLFGHHLQSFEENGFSFRIRDAEGQSIYTGGQQTGVSSEVSQQLNLETLGCTIEILADTQASESQLLQIKNGIILVVCSGAVVLLLISYVLTQKIFIRLNRVLFAVKRVQMGDFDFQLGMKTGDEVGELAQSIDIMIYKIRDLIEQNYKTQLAEKEAQLKFLQAQINPHFLYNTLEVIKMQAELKNQLEISDSISALGKVMRRALSGHLYDIIPLKEEIAYLESYFLLQKLIYMDRLTFVLDIPDTVKARLHTLNINKMLLQPLIENAIVHGMGTHKAITVTVGFRIDAQKLVARVHNTGNIIDPSTRARLIQELAQPENVAFRDVKGNGVGLINVSQRLRYIYGAEYGLTINSCAERGTEVSFCIPLEETEDV